MREVKLRKPHNRRIRVPGDRRAGRLKEFPVGAVIEVTEREFVAFRDRFIDMTPRAKAAPSSAPQANGDDALDALRARAEALGVKVSKRWGEKRLLEEIEAAEASNPSTKASEGSGEDPGPSIEQLRAEAIDLGISITEEMTADELRALIDSAGDGQ